METRLPALFVLLGFIVFGVDQSERPDDERGRTIVKATEHGKYALYVPRQEPRRMLVLIHGTIPKGSDGVAAAKGFLEPWIAEAERRKLILVAPAFDDANFGGHAGPGGGYRGLFGRRVLANHFANEIIDAVRAAHPKLEEKVDIVGHSAGGQFVSRYVVMHPQRVRAAVICAAGTFAFPDPDFPWAEGMGALSRTWRWGADEQSVEIVPDPIGWQAAALLPITVLAGEKDETPVPQVAGQRGKTLQERSKLWVDAMNQYAKQHNQRGKVQLKIVADAGHAMASLMPACRRALARR